MKRFFIGLALVGAIVAFMGVGISDHYVMTLKTVEPPYVWKMIGVGVGMMIPAVTSFVWKDYNGGKHNVHR